MTGFNPPLRARDRGGAGGVEGPGIADDRELSHERRLQFLPITGCTDRMAAAATSARPAISYDLFNALTGSRPVDVHACTIVPASDHWRRDDNFVATIRYADGSVCTLTYTSMGAKAFPKERADIFVDGKVMVLDDYKQLTVTGGKGGWKGSPWKRVSSRS